MSLPFEWRINHVYPLSIIEVIDHKLSLLFSGTHGISTPTYVSPAVIDMSGILFVRD